MAATTIDRGNPWASRARLIEWIEWWPCSDRGQGSQAGRGESVEATFSSCSWLLCILPELIVEATGLAVHRKLRSLLPEHFASYFVFDREKILFVKWWAACLCWRFFFVGTTIVVSLDGQQDVQFSKGHLPAERNWTDICKGPEHLLWTCGIPGVPTDPQMRLLTWVLKSLSPTGADATKQSQCAGLGGTDNPFSNSLLSAHLPSQWHTSSEPHCKVSSENTADSFFVHGMLPARRSPKQAKRADRNAKIKNPYL